jgi:hypothetical protein
MQPCAIELIASRLISKALPRQWPCRLCSDSSRRALSCRGHDPWPQIAAGGRGVVPRQADFSRFMLWIKCLPIHGVQLELGFGVELKISALVVPPRPPGATRPLVRRSGNIGCTTCQRGTGVKPVGERFNEPDCIVYVIGSHIASQQEVGPAARLTQINVAIELP